MEISNQRRSDQQCIFPFCNSDIDAIHKKTKNLTKRKKILCYKKSIVFMKWPRIILEILSLVTSMMSMETRFK